MLYMTGWTSATLVHVHLVFFCGTSDVLIMKGKGPCYVWIRLLYHTSIHVNLQICVYMYRWFTCVILLPQKFLPFDWLRAEVFQLNLKYLHVKITVTMVTQNHQIILSRLVAWIVRDVWHKYHLWYFKIAPNFTRLMACEIM